MRWKAKQQFNPYKWHRKFCLTPHKTIEGEWVWLETVWRRHVRFSDKWENVFNIPNQSPTPPPPPVK